MKMSFFAAIAMVTSAATMNSSAEARPMELIQSGLVEVKLDRDGKIQHKNPIRNAKYNVRQPPPPKPSRTHVCKRADLDARPSPGRGGEVFTKGACDASGKGPHAQWPLKATFQLTSAVTRIAGNKCAGEFKRRSRSTKMDFRRPFKLKVKFPGKLHIRYCFLDMKGKKTGPGKTEWHVDCKKDGIHRNYTVLVPMDIACVPQR
jgi:hypothetical protein